MAAVAAQRRGEEERRLVNEYCESHKVNDAVQEVILQLLESKPANPKEWLLKQIEDELTEESDNLSESDVHRLFAVTRKITSEIVPQDAVDVVIQETINLCGCDRVSLFVLDAKKNMLKLHASNMSTPIMVKLGQGIAGSVFQTKTSVNIPDCYNDKRFDQTFDQKTGYVTRSLLAVPIIDFEEQSVGVIQAINKIDPKKPVIDGKPVGTRAMPFTRNDEKILAHLTQHVGIALRNAEVYREAITVSERATGLLNTVQSLSQDLGTQSLLLMVTMHANKIVSAQRATVFLVDDAKEQLWSVSTDTGVEIRIPKHAGIAGECCSEGKTINIPDAYADPRFKGQAFDKKNNFYTQSILAIPMFLDSSSSASMNRKPDDKGCIGVIQMINKVSYDGQLEAFDEQDVEVLDMFSKFVSPKLASSNLLRKESHNKEGSADEASLALSKDQSDAKFNSSKRMSGLMMDSFAEGEMGEEEEDS